MSSSALFRSLYIAYRILFRSRSRGKRLLSLLLTGTLACGIFALILILSIMNGLQSGYIDAIVEVSSYHMRIGNISLSEEQSEQIRALPNVASIIPFRETQTVAIGKNGRFFGYLLRAVPENWQEADPGMAKQLTEVRGRLSFGRPNAVFISRTVALNMGLLIGDELQLISLSAPEFSLLKPPIQTFTVAGIYETAFHEIDELLILTESESLNSDFSLNPTVYGIKLKNRFADERTAASLKKIVPPQAQIESWRSFHRSFFSALKIEKFAMSFLLSLAAAVVVLNLYFMIKRLVFEKQKEIAVFKAMGISPREIRLSFLFVGILMGTVAVLLGVSLGLLATVRFSELILFIEALFFSIPGGFVPDFRFFYDLPIRIDFAEVAVIAGLSLAAAAAASGAATARITAVKPCEVMRYE